MDGGLADHALRRVLAHGARQDAGTDLIDISIRVLVEARALDDVAALEAHVPPRAKAEEFLRRILHEIIALDEHLAADGQFTIAHSGILRVVRDNRVGQRLVLPVFEYQLHRIEHRHAARRLAVENIAHLELQQCHIGGAVELGDADALAEIADGGGGITTAAHAGNRRQAGIVPTAHTVFLHQLEQLALAHHRVGEVEPRKLDLARLAGHRAVFNEPIVKRAVVLELQRAKRMGDMLQGILQGMREVIHRVDAPCIAGVVVMGMHDAVEHRIAHVHVRR